MLSFLIGLLIIIGGHAISYAITIGIIALVCLCFSWKFNILIATGIWLVLCLIKLLFPSK
jgi:hypothetical protein